MSAIFRSNHQPAILAWLCLFLWIGHATQQKHLAAQGVDQNSAETQKQQKISVITPYDIMTAEDEFYFHHIYQLTNDTDISNWPLVKSLLGLGGNYLDAPYLAELANRSIKINEQQRATKIMNMVHECAKTLGVDPPPVYIQGNQQVNAYVLSFTHPHILVLTSRLVEIYQDKPEELKFIIGHELGHIKAQHIRTHFIGRELYKYVFGRTPSEIRGVKDVISIAMAGILLHWYRESEYTADRAGLLCVGGRVEIAQQALLRLMHQTSETNKLMIENEKFSTTMVKQDQTEIRHRPFVQIYSLISEFNATHPFIPQRCEQIAQWRESEEYEALMSREELTEALISVTRIEISSLPDTDITIPFVDGPAPDSFLKLSYARDRQETETITNEKSPTWVTPKVRFAGVDGAGLIVDVFEKNSITSNMLIGSVRIDIQINEAGTFQSEADLRMDVFKESTIVDRPRVRVHYRVEK